MGKERNLVYDNRLTNYTPVTKIRGKVNREGMEGTRSTLFLT